jgi:hypothetical protein
VYPLCAGSVRDCRRAADHIGAAHFSEIDRATVALSQNVGITIVMEITKLGSARQSDAVHMQ